MTIVDRWLLPDGVDEVLPEQAAHIESLRRRVLNLYKSWGYELVIPPLVEFTESLLIGLGADVDLHAFKVTDQLSGRTMAIRPDITPQVARIDAHSLKREQPTRLCYAGSVLHTRAKSVLASRSPIQLGAELYGHSGLDADIEVISLMLDTLRHCGIESVHLDLGHVSIYRALIAEAGLSDSEETELFEALQRKASVEIESIIERRVRNSRVANWLRALVQLNGDRSVLLRARDTLAGAPAAVHAALHQLQRVSDTVSKRMPAIEQHFDLSELRGYHYHTGLVFAALVPGHGQALANGGRYDDIGAVFGRARPATGFSCDLKALAVLANHVLPPRGGIFVADGDLDDAGLWQRIAELRASGERVVCALQGQADDDSCDRILCQQDDQWLVLAKHQNKQTEES